MNYETELACYRSLVNAQVLACRDPDLLDLVLKLLEYSNDDHGCEIVHLFPKKEVKVA